MAEINRYSQMPAPLVVNPVSFEEFSRVPMARAIEKGAGLSALNRITTDYDVDEADLGKVTQMITGLDEVKSGIVDKITNSNIDSQTVNDVLNLKRQRDELYKTKINVAEQNKQIINNWRENVDRLGLQTSPEWANIVKTKGYKDWVASGGTFGDKGTDTKTFIPNLGVKYIDEDKDIKEQIDFASQMTQLNRRDWPGSTGTTMQGDNEFFTRTSAGWKEEWSNRGKMNFAKEMLKREYADQSTERGKYAAYGERDLTAINKKIDDYYNMRILDEKKMNASETSIGGATGRSKVTTTNDTESYEYNLPRTLVYQGNKKLEDAETSIIKRAVTAYEASKGADYKPTNVPTMMSLTQPLVVFFSKLFKPKSTEEYKAKVEAIKELNNTAVKLRDELQLITPKQYASAIAGSDKKAIEDVFDAIVDYQGKAVHNNAASSFDTKDYKWNDFGVDTKNDQEGSDIAAGAYNYTDVNTGELVGKDKDQELNIKALNGKLKVIGNITMGSRDLIGKNGSVKEDLTSGREVVDVETGEKYYVPLSPGLRKTPNYRRLQGNNNTLLKLAPGQRTPMVRYNPGTQNFEEVLVKHDDANIGHYVFVLGDTPNDEIPIDEFGSELRTKEFYETEDAPKQRTIQKAQVDAYMKSLKK